MEKTIENLAKAFVGESQARNRYTIYAKIANKEGYHQMGELFTLTAENEREHAKWLMRMITELQEKCGKKFEDIMIEASVPTTIGTTKDNLKAAIAGENYEYTSMYPDFAKVAKEEGLDAVSVRLFAIAVAESHHEERYKKLLNVLEGGTAWKKNTEKIWMCMKCGYVHKGEEAPDRCPSCDHPKEYFELECETY